MQAVKRVEQPVEETLLILTHGPGPIRKTVNHAHLSKIILTTIFLAGKFSTVEYVKFTLKSDVVLNPLSPLYNLFRTCL